MDARGTSTEEAVLAIFLTWKLAKRISSQRRSRGNARQRVPNLRRLPHQVPARPLPSSPNRGRLVPPPTHAPEVLAHVPIL